MIFPLHYDNLLLICLILILKNLSAQILHDHGNKQT